MLVPDIMKYTALTVGQDCRVVKKQVENKSQICYYNHIIHFMKE